MPPKRKSMALEATTIPVADDLPHPGCNCGRRRPAPPPATLLRGDLVIAARDRNREPELPAETVAHALATPVAPRLARYDVIIVASPAGETTHETRLAAEFARHEHRVFLLGDGPAAGRQVSAPTLRRLPQSRDILFAIRIYVDPLEALERHPQAPVISTVLVDQLLALSEEQLAYKGLTLERNRLAARLRQIAER